MSQWDHIDRNIDTRREETEKMCCCWRLSIFFWCRKPSCVLCSIACVYDRAGQKWCLQLSGRDVYICLVCWREDWYTHQYTDLQPCKGRSKESSPFGCPCRSSIGCTWAASTVKILIWGCEHLLVYTFLILLACVCETCLPTKCSAIQCSSCS